MTKSSVPMTNVTNIRETSQPARVGAWLSLCNSCPGGQNLHASVKVKKVG